MDLFILLGSGLLGAVFISSQARILRVSFLWAALVGCGGGAIVYLTLQLLDRLPNQNTMGALFLLFGLGGIAGMIAVPIYKLVRFFTKKR